MTFKYLVGIVCCTATLNLGAQTIDPHAGWHVQWNDSVRGANMVAARQWMQDHRIKPRKTIIVGIVDSGIEPTDQCFDGRLWTNAKEKKDGQDNDRNGYVDDVHGWNFLGTRDGSFNMTSAGTEEYREFKRLYPKYKNVDAARPQVDDAEEYAYYLRMKKKAGISGYIRFYGFARQKAACLARMDSLLRALPGMHIDTLTLAEMVRQEVADTMWTAYVQTIYADLLKADRGMTWQQFTAKQQADLALMEQRIYGIEHDKDKRLLMGDDMNNADDRFYGNNMLNIEGCDHGHFVASVVAGRSSDKRMEGVCPEARLMAVRCSPDGDEYDKDVASAIRYCVDNGARVINVSLGKYTSPRADMVDAALRYALDKDVLVVAAAGNNHLPIDTIAYYPSALDAQGRPLPNVIRVGASAMDGSMSRISNYGKKKVDLFAPGEEIAGYYPGDKAALADGTSVASPVVSGIAAMIRACFPKMRATAVKELLMSTVHHVDGMQCVSEGIVDALAAIRKASKK